jgi:hypothetical protein
MKPSDKEHYTIIPGSDTNDLPLDVKHLTVNFSNAHPHYMIEFLKSVKCKNIKLKSLKLRHNKNFIALSSQNREELELQLFDILNKLELTKITFCEHHGVNQNLVIKLGKLSFLKKVIIENSDLFISAIKIMPTIKIQSVILNDNIIYNQLNSNYKQEELITFKYGLVKYYFEDEVTKIGRLKDFILAKFSGESVGELKLEGTAAFKYYQQAGKTVLKYLFPELANSKELLRKVDDTIDANIFKFTCVSKVTVFEVVSQDGVKIIGESLGPQSLFEIHD